MLFGQSITPKTNFKDKNNTSVQATIDKINSNHISLPNVYSMIVYTFRSYKTIKAYSVNNNYTCCYLTESQNVLFLISFTVRFSLKVNITASQTSFQNKCTKVESRLKESFGSLT